MAAAAAAVAPPPPAAAAAANDAHDNNINNANDDDLECGLAALALSDPTTDEKDLSPVYAAVAAGKNADHVRRVLKACAQGSEERRAAAANRIGRRLCDDRQEEEEEEENTEDGYYDDQDEYYYDNDGEEDENDNNDNDNDSDNNDNNDEDEDEAAAAAPKLAWRDEHPLAAARRLSRGDLVGVLLVASADPRAIFGGQYTALALCALYNETDALRALLRSGRHDPCEKLDNGESWTAAHLCLRPPPLRDGDPCVPRLEALEIIVKEGSAFGSGAAAADLLGRLRDSHGRTPLFYAAQASCFHETALDVLLRLLRLGQADGGDEAVEAAVNARADLFDDNQTPLFAFLGALGMPVAAVLPCVRKLVAAGARPAGVFDAGGATPLMVAVRCMRLDAVRFLLHEVEVPVDERNPFTGATALRVCCSADAFDMRIHALLLDAEADPNGGGGKRGKMGRRTPLLAAVRAFPWAAAPVRLLLARGASPDVADSRGTTPLLQACGGDLADGKVCDVAELLARASSVETRRAVLPSCGRSAVDLLVEERPASSSSSPSRSNGYKKSSDVVAYEWRYELVALLMSSGVPVLPENAPAALELAVGVGAPLADKHEADLRARRREYWRRGLAHEDVARMAMEAKELWEAQRLLEETEARVAAAEAELRELGCGTHCDDDDEDNDDDDDSSSEQEEEEDGDV